MAQSGQLTLTKNHYLQHIRRLDDSNNTSATYGEQSNLMLDQTSSQLQRVRESGPAPRSYPYHAWKKRIVPVQIYGGGNSSNT